MLFLKHLDASGPSTRFRLVLLLQEEITSTNKMSWSPAGDCRHGNAGVLLRPSSLSAHAAPGANNLEKERIRFLPRGDSSFCVFGNYAHDSPPRFWCRLLRRCSTDSVELWTGLLRWIWAEPLRDLWRELWRTRLWNVLTMMEKNASDSFLFCVSVVNIWQKLFYIFQTTAWFEMNHRSLVRFLKCLKTMNDL